MLKSRLGAESLNESPKVVELDGLAVLRMIKLCRDGLPDWSSGYLVGMDVDGTLQVTNVVPTLRTVGSDGQTIMAEEESAQYIQDMMREMRTVNQDFIPFGWFLVAFGDQFMAEGILEQQYEHQSSIPKAVMVTLDPFKLVNIHSALQAFRAFRLTDALMQCQDDFSALDASSRRLAGQSQPTPSQIISAMEGKQVVEEIPVTITNSTFLEIYLNDNAVKFDEWVEKNINEKNRVLSGSKSRDLERSLVLMQECLDDVAAVQVKQMNYEKYVQQFQQSQGGKGAQRRPATISQAPPHQLDAKMLDMQMSKLVNALN